MTVPTNALTYNGYLQALAVLAVVDTTTTNGVVSLNDANLQTLVPSILNYAELRIQRDADLNAFSSSNSYSVTSGNNVFSIPVADFVAVQTVVVNGTPLTPVSREWMQNVYPTNSGSGPPVYFAPYGGDFATDGETSTNLLLGPWPDSNYPATVSGLIRAPSLALNATQQLAGSATTFISTWLPDLLLTASMIMVAGKQRDFSPMGNDPQAPVNWETQYQTLLKGAQVEEARKRFAASGWTSQAPPTVATPAR